MGPPGHGLVEALSEQPGTTVFIERGVSKGIDWERSRLIHGGRTLPPFGVGPDGDRTVEIHGETVFARADAWDREGRAGPGNEANAEAYRGAVIAAMGVVAERLGEAAIVLADAQARARGDAGRGAMPWPTHADTTTDGGGRRGGRDAGSASPEDDDIPF